MCRALTRRSREREHTLQSPENESSSGSSKVVVWLPSRFQYLNTWLVDIGDGDWISGNNIGEIWMAWVNERWIAVEFWCYEWKYNGFCCVNIICFEFIWSVLLCCERNWGGKLPLIMLRWNWKHDRYKNDIIRDVWICTYNIIIYKQLFDVYMYM